MHERHRQRLSGWADFFSIRYSRGRSLVNMNIPAPEQKYSNNFPKTALTLGKGKA
jgi:hypothetical protein